MPELEVHLSAQFVDLFPRLKSEAKKLVLESLRKISRRDNLEPDRRVADVDHEEICIIDFDPDFVLAYCIEYVESGVVIRCRTPVRILATLREASSQLEEIFPMR